MKRFMTPNWLTGICAAAGLICMALRFWLLSTGMDDRGLIDQTHPGNCLSWLVTGLVMILLLVSLRYQTRVRLTVSKKTAVSGMCSILGCLIACNMLLRSEGDHPLNLPAAIAAVAAAACRVWIMVNTCRRKRVPTLCNVPVTAFFLMFLVCRYQHWNSEPEPQLCVFHILALMGMALTVYKRGIMRLNRKKWKGYVAISRWTVFAALAAVPGCMDALPLLLWAGAVALDGCTPRKSQ